VLERFLLANLYRSFGLWTTMHMRLRSNIPPDHLLLDSAPNLGPLKSCWELDKFKNCW
jgi:hypothetical protein